MRGLRPTPRDDGPSDDPAAPPWRLDAQTAAALPPLAWYARIRRGQRCVELLHGSGVEVRGDRFFEGAWTGDFAAGRFDRALAFTGTGATLAGARPRFVGPTHLIDHLWVVGDGGALHVSNSAVFVLRRSGAELDDSYPYYDRDFVEILRSGANSGHDWVPLRRGQRLRLFHCRDFEVGEDLEVRPLRKRAGPAPKDFAGYVGQLSDAIGRLLENAADPARKQPCTPLATVSRGYDANAVAALARDAGCRRAVTLGSSDAGADEPVSDEGSEVARALDLECRSFDRLAHLELPGTPEAEFFAGPGARNACFLVLEEELRGRVLLTGHNGDRVLETRPDGSLEDWRRSNSKAVFAGQSLAEFRLRVGFFVFPVYFVAAEHAGDLVRISNSDEMKPWSIGGAYDRPIPRRILEERGVPRAAFGSVKLAGAVTNPALPVHTSDGTLGAVEALVRDSVWRRIAMGHFGRTAAWAYTRASAVRHPRHLASRLRLSAKRSSGFRNFHLLWAYRRVCERYPG